MAKKIYLSQIQAKVDRLQRERKQVLEHLELVDSKIKKLQDALEVMEAEALTNEYDTEVYSYRTYKRRLKGNPPIITGRIKSRTRPIFYRE